MSTNDYGRVPQIPQENPQAEQKEVFNTQTTKPQKEPTQTEDKKKLDLKAHLAKCREKSLAVRRAKAEERKKNKKPRGRPKKENVKMELEEKEQTLDDGTKVKWAEEKKEPEKVFNKPKSDLDNIQNDVMEKDQPKSNAMFDMDMLLNKLDERMDAKLKQFAPPPKQELPPAQHQDYKYFPNQTDLNAFYTNFKAQEDKIREDERNKILAEAKKQKEEKLKADTARYFRKMPPATLINSDNAWDNLLNPKKYS